MPHRRRFLALFSTFLLAVLALLLCPPAGQAFAPYPSHYRWYTLHTEQFAIHYPRHLATQAEHTAQVAEQVHGELTARFAWTPWGRTQVVLTDHMDFSNALATSFPYNTVVLMLRPAAPGEELANYRDWLHLLFAHEYAHIVHLDQVRGPNRLVRGVFGRILSPWSFPNWFSPKWQVEGLATYEETRLTGYGRTGGSYFAMIVRSAALAEQFPTLAQMQGFHASWPGGKNRYVFGAEFTDYIAGKHGEAGLYEQTMDYAGRLLPFRLNASFDRTIGERPGSLWREWKHTVEKQAATLQQQVARQGETTGEELTRRGYRIGAPRFSGDGRFLAYTESGAREYPSLRLLDLADGQDRELAKAPGATGLSFAPDDRRLAFSRWERVRSYQLYSDLYLHDLQARETRRLTTGARLRDPDFHPEDNLLIAVREGEGTTTLVLVDPDHGDFKPLRNEPDPVIYGRPRWSPNGRRLAVTAWRDGQPGLELIDARNGEVTRLLSADRATLAWPVWSRDGEYLYFTYDLDGIHNIYRLQPATGRLARVTNVVGGAFEPARCPHSGRLVFSGYSASGYDLVLLEEYTAEEVAAEFAPADTAWRPPVVATAMEPPADIQQQAEEDEPAVILSRHRYRAGATLLPRAWFPAFAVDEEGSNYGLSVESFDPLRRHYLHGTALYGSASHRWAWAATYRNHWFFPIIELHASDFAAKHGYLWAPPADEEGYRSLPSYWERRRNLQASLLVPLLRLRWGLVGRLGVREQRLEALKGWPAGEEAPAQGRLRGTVAGISFDNREQPGLAISPESGVLASLQWNHFNDSLGGDFNIDEFIMETRAFLRVPFLRRHVLAWWLKGGLAEGDRLLQRRFQLGGFMPPEALLGESGGGFPLRGYPQAVQRGDRILRSTLEYRFPLIYHEAGPAIFPLFLDRSHLTLFGEAGAAWDGSWESDNRIKSSVGTEYKLNLVLGHLIHLDLRLGLAHRLDSARPREDRTMLYLALGHQF